ncbi:hypothetical protein BYT27DRAFT_6574661 [Phlegmacium glaucopus]|nr:hypothetical protein BYT27DRAFT_6574661 [Phlegmacium glaucopus]
MARLPTRKSLQSMKRVDLQKICKDYGVKANLKSEALIDLLLETQSPPTPQPTRRSVSTRQSSRQGPSRVTSMIVHDIDEEEENLEKDRENTSTEEAQQDPSPAPPRTRKAKETQTRLGVGRPLAVGGQGPRAVTRSSGSSRGKEAKSSKSHKPKEPTIQEELEVLSIPTDVGPTDQEHRDQQNAEHLPSTLDNKVVDINFIVENAVRPLQDQVKALKLELEQMRAMKADIAELQLRSTKAQAQFESLNALSTSVISLKDEMKQIRENLSVNSIPSQPSTPKPQRVPKQRPIGRAFGMPSSLRPPTASLPTQVVTPLQTQDASTSGPVMPKTLGKRRRANNTSDVVEQGQEAEYSDAELASSVVGPDKKRLRTARDTEDNDDDGSASSSDAPARLQDTQQTEASNSNRGVPAFTIFTDSDEPSDYLDPPPPTDHLPDFFEPHSPSSSSLAIHETKLTTTTANATENRPQGFNFSFLPISSISSTPLNAMYMPSFPYPEPPQSPSPAGAHLGTLGRHAEERTDIFKEFGFPSPTRLARSYAHQEERGGFVNPAALTQQGASGRQREVSSNEIAAGLGLTAVRTLPTSETASGLEDHPPIMRTMYGTELDGNTRFGDFGVEGVATGFWSAGKI